ncbi:MAG: 50S ribosomal protein L9 [Pseudomonadales bacterium]
MNVILLEAMGKLGDLGDEVGVKGGFARNFLIPQGKAVRATNENRKIFEERRAELERAASDKLNQAKGRSAQLVEQTISLMVKAGEEGKLYGSIGTQDIADAITAKIAPVDRSEVRLPEGVIRQLGEYQVDIQLHSEVMVQVAVEVIAE